MSSPSRDVKAVNGLSRPTVIAQPAKVEEIGIFKFNHNAEFQIQKVDK